ncbi:hypothetical protein U14_01949 [Candidatus Moduliflexus flocculans]|uniref:Uncharacterized protein n=1 Tax=Candidatus Moduliflexus flocculans TaxID=1499966 RepID=A0A0S6VXR4_9BACT|nr:hypothetical protein U14_01949 [Candidatus Moduliflexus flocculans]
MKFLFLHTVQYQFGLVIQNTMTFQLPEYFD